MLKTATLKMKLAMAFALVSLVGMSIVTGFLTFGKSQALRQEIRLEQDLALGVLSANLGHEAGMSRLTGNNGRLTGAIWVALPEFTDYRIIDRTAEDVAVTTSVLAFSSENQAFERVVSSARNNRGKRLAGAALTQETTAALLDGRATRGETAFGETPYLARWLPITDEAGRTIGALEAAVPRSRLDGPVLESVRDGIIVTALAVATAIGAALLYLPRALRPVEDLRAATQVIAAGNFGVPVPHVRLPGAIGGMARSLQDLARKLGRAEGARAKQAQADETARARADTQARTQARVVRELGEGLKRLANGDLTRPIASPPDDPFPTTCDELRQSYNQVVDELGRTLAAVAEAVDGVRGDAGEIHQASEDLAARAESQAATLEQSAAALNQLTESVKSTSTLASRAENAGQNCRDQAEGGAVVVREAMQAMAQIEASSEKVRRIIAVIDDIAFQTNLLALNAGVEAARAGEAGKGFAVVASEVRALAQRAADSAREIGALINESATHVSAGNQLVTRSGERLEAILENTVQLQGAVSEIAGAAREQALGIQEINDGVGQLDAVTQQNAAVAEQVQASANSLDGKSAELARNLAQFRTVASAGAAVADPVERPTVPADGPALPPVALAGPEPDIPPRATGTDGPAPLPLASEFDGF